MVLRAQFTLRLGLETGAKIKKIAKGEHRSTANMIEYIISKEIERYEAAHGEIELTDDELYG